jgi:hypothetical protein
LRHAAGSKWANQVLPLMGKSFLVLFFKKRTAFFRLPAFSGQSLSTRAAPA